jgi:L-threonylcarbamoyladenylate synthase
MEAACSAKFAAPSHPYSSALFRRLRAHLQRGGVIAYATESCYGLGCDPRNYQAVRQLLKIKGRPVNKGLILIGAKFAQLESFVAPLNEQEKNSLKQFWPGPVTLLMPAARHTPKWLTGRHTSIAVRVTAHLDAAYLCRQLDMALVWKGIAQDRCRLSQSIRQQSMCAARHSRHAEAPLDHSGFQIGVGVKKISVRLRYVRF